MFKRIVFIWFLCFAFVSNAQVADSKKTPPKKSTPLELEEKEKIATAFKLLNNNECQWRLSVQPLLLADLREH